jgi:RimJ/RimL family protein N-acetyltransferase
VSVSIRAATREDVDFLVELYIDEEVKPFLAAGRSYDRAWVDENLAGLVVVELGGKPAGAMAWEVASERNRIVRVGGVAVHPRSRGHRIADDAARLLQRHLIRELGFHRIELEIYGFNERAQRHAERAGFVREGVKRQAYSRDGEWVDGVLYGLVEDDLAEPR